MAEQEGFVRRWSRRKSAAREQARAAASEPAPATEPEGAAAAIAPAAPGSATAAAEPAPRGPEPAVDLSALPDVETLTYEFDFTVFLRPGVPAELRKRALQRLWRSDPVLANLDGLLEYGQDYSQIGITKQLVRTAYQVGRGMLERLEPGSPRGEPEPAGQVANVPPASEQSADPAPEPSTLAVDADRQTTARSALAAAATADPAGDGSAATAAAEIESWALGSSPRVTGGLRAHAQASTSPQRAGSWRAWVGSAPTRNRQHLSPSRPTLVTLGLDPRAQLALARVSVGACGGRELSRPFAAPTT